MPCLLGGIKIKCVYVRKGSIAVDNESWSQWRYDNQKQFAEDFGHLKSVKVS